MRICLFNPPNLKSGINTPEDYYSWVYRERSISLFNYVCPPDTLCQLSSLLKREYPNAEVRIFDARLAPSNDPKDVLKTIREEFMPDLVVMLIGAYTINHDIRYIAGELTTIGLLCPVEVSPELALRFYDIPLRYFVKNEVENTILCAVKDLAEKGSIEKTRGLLVREGKKLRDNGDSAKYPLKDLPMPDYASVPIEKYFKLLGADFSFKRTYFDSDRYATIFNNRGCVFNCRFCNLGIGGYDSKTAEQIAAEMRYFVENHSCNNFVFMGNEFSGNNQRAKEICGAIIASGLKVNWSSGDRVEYMDEELVALMARSGCRCLMLGVETADPKLRKKYDRQQSDAQFEKVFGWCRKYGILTYANIIGGLIDEDEETLRYNLQFIKKCRPDHISMHYFFLAPGSSFYNEMLEKGRIKHHDWSRYYWYFTERDGIYYEHGKYNTYSDLFANADLQARRLRQAIYGSKITVGNGVRGLLYVLPYIKNSEFFERVIIANFKDSAAYARLEKLVKRGFKKISYAR